MHMVRAYSSFHYLNLLVRQQLPNNLYHFFAAFFVLHFSPVFWHPDYKVFARLSSIILPLVPLFSYAFLSATITLAQKVFYYQIQLGITNCFTKSRACGFLKLLNSAKFPFNEDKI